MELLSLSTSSFRNLSSSVVRWMNGANLVLGGNGQGKTNLLEAVVLLATLRSFRTANLRRVVRHQESCFRLEGEVRSGSGSQTLSQVVEVGPPARRELAINGARVEVGPYLSAFPICTITPGDAELVTGVPEQRRSFLDRFSFLLDESHLQALRRFRRALRQRNSALRAGWSDCDLAVWDEELARSAAVVVARRLQATARLQLSFRDVYATLSCGRFPEIEIAYRGEGWAVAERSTDEMRESYLERLLAGRSRDRDSGYTVEGPHRHDLALKAEGRLARDVLSSGQVKVVSAALRLSTLAELEQVRGETLPVVVDDVDSALDHATLRSLLGYLGGDRQLLLSSSRREVLVDLVDASTEVWVSHGVCRQGPGSEHP